MYKDNYFSQWTALKMLCPEKTYKMAWENPTKVYCCTDSLSKEFTVAVDLTH